MKKKRASSTPPTPATLANPAIKTAVSPEAPFADLMLHPGKINTLLKTGAAPSAAPGSDAPQSGAKTGSEAGAKSATTRSGGPVRKTVFHLQSHAKSVQVAGDFTGWEKTPINMESAGSDEWSAAIPLEPGQYAYRFIVDGEWCDDPNCTRRVTNAFGSQNSVIDVT